MGWFLWLWAALIVLLIGVFQDRPIGAREWLALVLSSVFWPIVGVLAVYAEWRAARR